MSELTWKELIIQPALHKKWTITLGNFDGGHLGHCFLLKALKQKAKETSSNSGVISFLSHPQKTLQKKNVYEISNLEQKKKFLQQQKMDSIFFLQFTPQLAQISPTNFLKFLCKKIEISHFFVGYDFRFGKDRKGNIDLLQEVAKKENFEVIFVEPLKKKEVISSSLIRSILKKGDFTLASKYLGRNWSVCASVIKGKKLGRKLGFPTANLFLDFYPPLQKGVYLVEVTIKNKVKKAVANYGFAPSLHNPREKPLLECHLLDFQGDFYGEVIEVVFKEFLRPEKKFSHLDLLKKQIIIDLEKAKYYFSNKKLKNANTY